MENAPSASSASGGAHQRQNENRPIRKEKSTRCVQTRPTVLVFGNLMDKDSRVRRLCDDPGVPGHGISEHKTGGDLLKKVAEV
jgi:hypothetical protein